MKKIPILSLVVCCCMYAAVAHATLIGYNNRASFNSQGSIAFNYGYEDFTGSPYYLPGDPWTSHGVTYTTTRNLIVGPSLGYGNSSNVFAFNFYTPLTATISPNFDMFALDLAVLGTESPLNFQIKTNLATYTYNNLNVLEVQHGLDFYGFVAGAGEFFTSFRLDSVNGVGSAPVIDNVTLGNSTPQPPTVPEPSTLFLLGVGLLGVGMLKKRIRR